MPQPFHTILFSVTRAHPSSTATTSPCIATLTFNRPAKGNAINAAMAQEIVEAIDICDRDPHIRLLIVTGAGNYFCTGMDMKAATSQDATHASTSSIDMFQLMFERLHHLRIPTLCLLNGPALGGGVGFVFICDMRVSTHPNHYLALTECKRGLVPALISIYIVPELPPCLSMEMMVMGDRVPVTVFHRLGVFNGMVVPDQGHDKTQGRTFATTEAAVAYFSELIGSSAPGAVMIIKKLVRRLTTDEAEREKQKAYLRSVFQEMMTSEEAMYGMMCFLQKQKPDWSSLLLAGSKDAKL